MAWCRQIGSIIGVVRQQTTTWVKIDPELYDHMASLGY